MANSDLADMGAGLALDVVQAAISLAVKRFTEGKATAVTEVEIERAAELFGVGPHEADQIMLIYELLVAFGNSLARKAEVTEQ